MRGLWVAASFAFLTASFSGGQQTSPSVPSQLADAQPAPVKVYAVGPGVTTPALLPLNLPPFPAEKCKKKMDGEVELSVIVDADGRPRNLGFLHPLSNDLDKFALQIVAADRFNPGTRDGTPVAVGQSVEVSMQACLEQTKDDAGKKAFRLRLRSEPVQALAALPHIPEEAVLAPVDASWKDSDDGALRLYRVGGGVSAPVPLNSVQAEFTDAARRAKYQGVCLVSTIVDRNGMPQDVRVVRKLDYGLDQSALDAVRRYRFKPAMRNGEPVPTMVTIEVNFRLY